MSDKLSNSSANATALGLQRSDQVYPTPTTASGEGASYDTVLSFSGDTFRVLPMTGSSRSEPFMIRKRQIKEQKTYEIFLPTNSLTVDGADMTPQITKSSVVGGKDERSSFYQLSGVSEGTVLYLELSYPKPKETQGGTTAPTEGFTARLITSQPDTAEDFSSIVWTIGTPKQVIEQRYGLGAIRVILPRYV